MNAINKINNLNISLLPHDVVFGRRGRKCRDGSHITKGTQQLWMILLAQYKANGPVDLQHRRIIAKNILTLLHQELPAGSARFVRLHQPNKGSQWHSYRWMTNDNVLEAISKMYYSMQKADRKKNEKMLAAAAVAAAKDDSLANADKSEIARMDETCLQAATSVTSSTNMMVFPPLQDPSGITILDIQEEKDNEKQVGEE